MPRDWQLRIRDIIGSIEKIQRYTSDIDYVSFRGDDRTVDAVIRNLQIIGEAARYIPPSIEHRWPEIPWAEMRGMRNIVIHQYFGIDTNII